MKTVNLFLGDIHYPLWDQAADILIEQYNKTPFKNVFQAGDFGYFPRLINENNKKWLQKLIDFVEEKNINFYWIDGNHDDHSVLQYIDDFNNTIHNIMGKNFFYQPRGSFMEFDDKIIFFLGGAESKDWQRRTLGIDYFREEIIMPSQSYLLPEKLDAVKSKNKPVIVLAHTVPHWVIQDKIFGFENYDTGLSIAQNQELDYVVDELKPELYIHGHIHHYKEYERDNTKYYSLGGILPVNKKIDDIKTLVLEF